jgi:hypothetical protein
VRTVLRIDVAMLFNRTHGGSRARLALGATSALLVAVATALAVPALALAGGSLAPPPDTHHEAAEAGRWALLLALLFLVLGIPLIAYGTRWIWWRWKGARRAKEPGLWWGSSLVVGDDGRVSTSKTAALVWTYTLAAALLSFVIARWFGHPEAYDALVSQSLDARYALLIGGPIGAAILAKGIVSTQIESGELAKPAAEGASPAQLVQNDAGSTDLGDVQYLLFNAIALVFFYGELLRLPTAGLPTLPDVLVGLTSVAAVGFVAKKTLSGPPSIVAVTPSAASVGTRIQIVTSGVTQAVADLPALTVAFGSVKAEGNELELTPTSTAGVLVVAVVPPRAAGKVDLEVSLPNGKKASWPEFSIRPEITSDRLVPGPKRRLRVATRGVTGLGPRLAHLRVTVGGRKAEVATGDEEDEIVVVIPDEVDSGPQTLELRTPGGSAQAEVRVPASR